MSLNFYQPQSNQHTQNLITKSQNTQNYRFFNHNKKSINKKSNSIDHKQIQQFKNTMKINRNLSPLPQQQKFFPSIRPKVRDAIKAHQLFTIKQKQKRQSFMVDKKIKIYKQILLKQQNIKKSKQKYLSDRFQRYDKIKNISFIGLKQKLEHDNRFNMRSNTSLQKQGLQFRSSSLYFRTLDQLDSTIHKINNKNFNNYQNNRTIQVLNSDRKSLHKIKGLNKQRSANFNKYNYRYFDEENTPNQQQNDVKIDAIQNTYKKKRVKELSQERQRINEMVKMYREYQEQQALNKISNLKS